MNGTRLARYALNAIAALVAIYMLAPLVVTVLVSFSSSSVFNLPPPQWSLRWYAELARKEGLWPALTLSIYVALLSTAIALVLGTLTAIAVEHGRFRGREAALAFMVSPLMMPGQP